jgi:hypothetical protein
MWSVSTAIGKLQNITNTTNHSAGSDVKSMVADLQRTLPCTGPASTANACLCRGCIPRAQDQGPATAAVPVRLTHTLASCHRLGEQQEQP